MQEFSDKKTYKHTLNLPNTDFPIRANHTIEDSLIIERWENEDVYRKTFEHNKGKQAFLLSDGPPYANGSIHLGHAYNKILKDIVAKSRRMMGFYVPCVPGWDCHGLPIEIKVTQENKGLSRLELKKACRAYADGWIKNQIVDFKKIGVLMDWDRPYKTMDFSYEASVIRSFGKLVQKGFIERKNKTVSWCASCQTVLATAEIEYAERKDPSIYVLFELDHRAKAVVAPSLQDKKVFFIVWTTTPWTLPLNRAVLLNPIASYTIIALDDSRYGILGTDLLEKFFNVIGEKKDILMTFNVEKVDFAGARVQNPIVEDYWVPIIKDSSVLLTDGTACVHSAPGAGPEDYEVGVKNNLEIFSPVGPDGVMTDSIEPRELVGKSIEQVQSWVLQALVENQKLFYKTSIKHMYPHCWRCRKGLIFRATKQWFCSLTHNQLKERAIDYVNDMLMLPEGSNNRLQATIGARYEWCLSRQRVWGTPIPAVLCSKCDYVYCETTFVEQVAKMVEEDGVEAWETVDVATLVPKDYCCFSCGNKSIIKEQDILDVWFDAGLSHTAVYKNNPDVHFPLDVYLEGKDQHRGYFQSALLTSVALHDKPCMKAIITHGFTVDQTGKKMSKSLSNGVSPQQIIDKVGVDGLRLWAASIDISGEAVVSDALLSNIEESYRKIRNTCRFLLSNIYDFSYEADALQLDELLPIDKYALYELYKVHNLIMQTYNIYNFTAVFHALVDYCTTGLSAFYLDIVKDRLYVAQKDGRERRSAQTVCFIILDTLARDMAPILSLLAEQLTDHYQATKNASIHLQSFSNCIDNLDAVLFASLHPDHQSKEVFFEQYEYMWIKLKKMRSVLLKAIENLREKGVVKHSLEAKVTIAFNENSDLFAFINQYIATDNKLIESFIAEFTIVSQAVIGINKHNNNAINEDYVVEVCRAEGTKCPRCWQWHITNQDDGLCSRCQKIVL
ncbi:isoleucine--tRNA ligase [Candidatus Dependentiae bacterium]|nr:MAG: isoleucine--tRNA ligase [Candidatus Dependentiae bacterium]